MPRFRMKSYEVDAFQITGENRDAPGTWPDWATAAYAKVWNEPGAVSDMLGSRNLYVRAANGQAMQICALGDWIAREDDGGLIVVQGAMFAECFEPAAREQAA